MITWAMAANRAASVVGLRGIHWSAKVAAVSVHTGSMTTTLAPAALALPSQWQLLVSNTVSAGLNPLRTMSLECRRVS